MDSIKGLLDGMLKRHQITAQVTTARVIEVANESLARILPPGRSADAVAVSVRDGELSVRCQNASATSRVQSRSDAILDEIKRALPAARVDRVRTKIDTAHLE